MKPNPDPDQEYVWTLGNLLFRKYIVSVNLNSDVIGIGGEDVLCNEWQEVYKDDNSIYIENVATQEINNSTNTTDAGNSTIELPGEEEIQVYTVTST